MTLLIADELYGWLEIWWPRMGLGLIGLALLLHAMWGKVYRWGFYDFEDESDIILERRTGKIFEALIGIVLIVGAVLYQNQQ